MMDDFLDKFEIVGNKMRPVLEGDTPADKLNTVRRALGEVPNDVRTGKPRRGGDNDDGDILMPYDIDDRKERWDCETILSMCP